MAGVETLNAVRGKLARKAMQLNARHARRRGLPSIVLMTDDRPNVDWVAAARALPGGSAVIVRHRDGTMRQLLARELHGACKERRVKLLIADDPALAVRLRANGVHLPERRMALAAGLKGRNASWLVTTSAHGAASARRAVRLGVDAVFIAPVFPTSSHPDGDALGVVRLAAIVCAAQIPAYALGGIDATTAGQLRSIPLCGIAFISGWIGD